MLNTTFLHIELLITCNISSANENICHDVILNARNEIVQQVFVISSLFTVQEMLFSKATNENIQTYKFFLVVIGSLIFFTKFIFQKILGAFYKEGNLIIFIEDTYELRFSSYI